MTRHEKLTIDSLVENSEPEENSSSGLTKIIVKRGHSKCMSVSITPKNLDDG